MGPNVLLTFQVPYRKFSHVDGAHGYVVTLKVKLSTSLPNSTLTKTVDCIVDSGATRCCFHADVAEALGLDLKAGRLQTVTGISGPENIWIHEITLHLPGGKIRIKAGFKESLSVVGLLGMGGFFEFFNITFDSVMERCSFQRIYRV